MRNQITPITKRVEFNEHPVQATALALAIILVILVWLFAPMTIILILAPGWWKLLAIPVSFLWWSITVEVK